MLYQEIKMSKYKVVIELHFSKRPSKKTILNSLFDMLRDNKVNYELHKQNKDLERRVKNDKHK